jgi:hypothetical protein
MSQQPACCDAIILRARDQSSSVIGRAMTRGDGRRYVHTNGGYADETSYAGQAIWSL